MYLHWNFASLCVCFFFFFFFCFWVNNQEIPDAKWHNIGNSVDNALGPLPFSTLSGLCVYDMITCDTRLTHTSHVMLLPLDPKPLQKRGLLMPHEFCFPSWRHVISHKWTDIVGVPFPISTSLVLNNFMLPFSKKKIKKNETGYNKQQLSSYFFMNII